MLEEAAKKRALTADEKSVLANKDEVLARAEVNARLGDQIVAQERLNAPAGQLAEVRYPDRGEDPSAGGRWQHE